MMPEPQHTPKVARFFPSTWAGRCALISIAWGLLMIVGWVLNTEWDKEPATNRPTKNPVGDYVSADTCRSCHPGNYASWHASYHRTMTQVANSETILADMAGLEITAFSTDYIVLEQDGKHYVRSKPEGAPEAKFTDPQEIVLLTGSHNMQICWMTSNDGRTVEQFPFAYIVAEDMWVPMTHSFLMPPEHITPYSKGEWNISCINCHVTKGRSRIVEGETFDSDVSDFGISCEACHSGGREHVELNRDPTRRFKLHLTDTPDQTIANPADMDGPTSSLLCGQCHSIWNFNNAEAHMEFVKENSDFRPGHTELKLRNVPQPSGADAAEKRAAMIANDAATFDNSYWRDGMVRVTGREYNGVTASPCFKGKDFSCLSCHEMHPANTEATALKQWAKNQMAPGKMTNQACLQCHQDMAADISAHTYHPEASTGSSCYNCHMPHSSFGLLRGVRSHEVASPSAIETIELGRPNACNLCHLDQPLAWTAGKLHEWYGHDIPVMEKDDHEISLAAKWILKGDAAQRALISWSMGWEPAQRASDYRWLYPFLIFELNDPYPAVRFVAWKSLQSLPGFSGYKYDYTVNDDLQKEASARAYQKWWQEQRDPRHTYEWKTLLQPNGTFRQSEYERLLRERDNRKVNLLE